ncbi:hypothetical protein VXQ92_04755 [Acinetobacter sp. 228]|uniref:hypothetical protein n=1 Tax=Acinetobacter sp. 228 TaxID=3114700 RepID=UPI003A874A8B
MALTIDVDFKLEKVMKGENNEYVGKQYFIKPSEQITIFTQLQQFLEERVSHAINDPQYNGRVEVPIGIDPMGRYRSPTIWDNVEQDLKDFSALHPNYYFKLKLIVDGYTAYSQFFLGRQQSIKKNEYHFLNVKKDYYFICAEEQYLAEGSKCTLQQLLELAPQKLRLSKHLAEFLSFCFAVFDEDNDYYAANLIYVPLNKFNSHDYVYKTIKIDHGKKSKRLDAQYYSLNRVAQIAKAFQYAHQQQKFDTQLAQYAEESNNLIKQYYQHLMKMTEYTKDHNLAILLVLVPADFNENGNLNIEEAG